MDKKGNKKDSKKPHIKYPKQQYKEKIKKQRAQYHEKYMQEMSKELNPSARTLQDIFALDDEEVKHRQYLEATYKQLLEHDYNLLGKQANGRTIAFKDLLLFLFEIQDRAKERRQGGNFGDLFEKGDSDNIEDDENIELPGNEIIQTNEEQEIKKGLDMEMYLEEVKQQEIIQNKFKKVKQNESTKKPQIQQEKKKKGLLASAIERRILQNKELQNSNLFNPNIHYEYEIDDIFDISVPKSIVKKSKRNDEEDPKIIMKTNEKLLKKIGDFVEAVASGRPIVKKQQMKTMEIENYQENQKQKEKFNYNYSDSDNIFSENDDKQFEKIKPSLSLLAPEANDTSQPQEFPKPLFEPQNPKQFSIFQDLTSNPKYLHENEPESTEINNETLNQINMIQKNVLGQSKTRLEEKLALLNSDQYMECYPTMDPSISELKQAGGLAANYNIKRFGSKGSKKGKEHKVDKVKENSKFQRVNQIMKDKQKK